MITEQQLEKHYNSLTSDILHIIREEYKWAHEECNIENRELLEYVEHLLSMRGESLESHLNRKVLFLCKCGQSRIVTTSTPDDKMKMFIFDQYSVPCPKCRNTNLYSWKYLD